MLSFIQPVFISEYPQAIWKFLKDSLKQINLPALHQFADWNKN